MPRADGSAEAPNPSTSWEASSETTEAEHARSARGGGGPGGALSKIANGSRGATAGRSRRERPHRTLVKRTPARRAREVRSARTEYLWTAGQLCARARARALSRGRYAVAHGRRERAGRAVEKLQVTGQLHRGPATEGGEESAQIMSRAERNMYRARVESLLDERDHAILLSLLEHKVLTTDQIKSLLFRSIRRCHHRLRELKDLGVIAAFTRRRGFAEGRAPACWFLTKTGLSEIADAKGVRPSDLAWVPDESYQGSRNLAHRLGVNAFFCALAEASRAHQEHCLAAWRPERWVRTRAAEVKPDGFGRYLHPAGACEFYLEYDRGTETIGALSRKLEGYLRLATTWSEDHDLTGFPNLLIVVPERVREGEVGSALRHAIGRVRVPGSLAKSFPLYVAGEDALTRYGVLAPAWNHLLIGTERLSLVTLPARPHDPNRATRCLGRYFTDPVRDRRRRISPASTPPRFAMQPPRLPP